MLDNTTSRRLHRISDASHGVDFHDLGFQWREVVYHAANRDQFHWVPYGMPKITPRLLGAIFYLYRRTKKSGELEGPGGTGFFVLRGPHIYAITNRHITHGDGASIIRINTNDGKTRLIELATTDWLSRPDFDDISAADITDLIDPGKDEICTIAEDKFAHEKFLADANLGPGDDTFMLGLFTNQPGEGRNTPAARFGNISLLADRNNPVFQGNNISRPSHIIDTRSRGGFSGSPVFVYRTPLTDLESIDTGKIKKEGNLFFKLLGIHSAQYPDHIEIKRDLDKRIRGESLSGGIVREGDHLIMPSSMTVVVPALRITELLDMDHFRDRRAVRENRLRHDRRNDPIAENSWDSLSARAVTKARTESVFPAPSTKADNPSHREDFNRLLDAVAKKPKQDD